MTFPPLTKSLFRGGLQCAVRAGLQREPTLVTEGRGPTKANSKSLTAIRKRRGWVRDDDDLGGGADACPPRDDDGGGAHSQGWLCHFVGAAKLNFVSREKRILLVAFSRARVDVRGEG